MLSFCLIFSNGFPQSFKNKPPYHSPNLATQSVGLGPGASAPPRGLSEMQILAPFHHIRICISTRSSGDWVAHQRLTSSGLAGSRVAAHLITWGIWKHTHAWAPSHCGGFQALVFFKAAQVVDSEKHCFAHSVSCSLPQPNLHHFTPLSHLHQPHQHFFHTPENSFPNPCVPVV